ncbi:decarboxylating 6-phosphogluconate dehydrogenase [Candidatus Microgenomates bacterium]|nr:decarboxylating 6-phosphogluconate dehydrogenase [Candidatus Microgenomates bacterium]
MKIGFIGLGRMGSNMVLNLLEKGVEVVAWNRSPEPVEEVVKAGAMGAKSIDDLVSKLEQPRIIWLMVTAGEVVDEVLNQLIDKLSPNDLVIDGGNSFYKDTLRRAEMLSKKGIHFMDVGTSGGIEGARHGACLMVGGSREDYERILPVLKAAAAPDAYGLVGKVGAGHFAKTIHNGIEYGMMEAIGEGAAILKASPFNYDLREVFRIYNTGSIIESRLVGWTLAELKADHELSNISSVIGSAGGGGKTKGEGHWTVELAKEMGIDVPVIEASVKVRDESEKDREDSANGFRNKVVAAMRWQFGQHPVKKQK